MFILLSNVYLMSPGGVWWYTPAIPTLGRLRQEDPSKLEASLGYLVNSRPAWTR